MLLPIFIILDMPACYVNNRLQTVDCRVDMIYIDRQIIPSFWSHKIIQQKDLEVFFIYLLKKVNAILRSIFQYYVSNRHFLCQILLYIYYITHYQIIDLKIAITFLSKLKYIFLDPFLCNLVHKKHGIRFFFKKRARIRFHE